MDSDKEYEGFIGREVHGTPTAEDNALLREIRDLSLTKGMKHFRVKLHRSVHTMDFRTDRLNVRLSEEKDGKRTITGITIG